MTKKSGLIVPDEMVMNKIYYIRETKVMLDMDLSALYEVNTSQLKRQVKRNLDRFPKDFMFTLTRKEVGNLRRQTGISSWGGTRYLPMAFTEQGVAMLSSVLSSKRAIRVNIQIIRIFNRIRQLLQSYEEVLSKVEELERRTLKNTHDIKEVFDYLKQLLVPREQVERRRIGFRVNHEDQCQIMTASPTFGYRTD